ncbi:MAG: primosomal protein N' [Ignavibacteria bacterium]|nr:primosomal protein N' [Ignavibacteria bacterium]
MNRYAEVALPVAIDKTFTYVVPDALDGPAQVGVRVIVPFGRKYVTGLIVHRPDTSQLSSLKQLHDVLDAGPVVSGELLDLCKWIAEYYFSPLGEVLKAALPHALSSTSKRVVRPRLTADELQSVLVQLQATAPKRAEVLSLVVGRSHILSTELQKRTGTRTINAILNELERAGYIETEESIPRPAARAKMREFLQLSRVDGNRLALELLSLSPRKRKGRTLLECVRNMVEHGLTEIAVPDLLKEAGASSATLKEFRASGLLPTDMKEVSRQTDYGIETRTRSIVLNSVQAEVLGQIIGGIDAEECRTYLLHGVTGSGKTQVYIEAIRHCIGRNKTAIVLVPEISLTPQTVRRFKSHFAERVAVVHSRMSPGERHDVWRHTLLGDYSIVIGPRSAVFAPLANLGLIVVDEEHEASYKQFDSIPRYNARDVAIVRGTMNRAAVVLGSATPSVESYYNATLGKFTLLEMPQRVDSTRMPHIAIVDMTLERKREYAAKKDALAPEDRKRLKDFRQSSVSSLLREKIEDRLSRGEGIILLQNRRGFAPFVECPECGYAETCDSCNVSMTYHITKKHLRCHYCGQTRAPHTICPQCGGVDIRMQGAGTQRIEQDLEGLFPKASVLRMDLDTTSRKGAHDRILKKFGGGDADILLGTQMVAKGLDFARVTLVGVISADTQMLLPDFRSSERTFQLLTQVAGRAGRSELHGEVLIQTHQPQHYTLQHVVDHDFPRFYEEELQARRELEYPPFSRLVLVESKGPEEDDVRRQLEHFTKLLQGANGSYTVLGPSPAVIGKIKNMYRWHTIIKNLKTQDPSGSLLRRVLRKALATHGQMKRKSVRLTIDVDPVGLM